MTIKISYFSATGGEMGNLGIALSEVMENYDIKINAKSRIQLADDFLIDDFILKSIESDFIYIGLHGGEDSCPALIPLMEVIEERKKSGEKIPYIHVQGDMEAVSTSQKYSTEFNSENWKKIVKYSAGGGVVNLKNMILLMSDIVSDENIPHDEPVATVQNGIYHPDLKKLPTSNN